MELVNTGRRVRNPLQHKGFRRFQNCLHRPRQTRKYQVRTRLEIRCTGNSTVGSNPTRCAMNNSSANWWSYYSYHGGIRKAALSDMPVACRNRRGFSAEKESHSLRHQEPVIKPITGSFLFPKRAIPCSFTFSERKSSVLPNINRSPPAFEVAALFFADMSQSIFINSRIYIAHYISPPHKQSILAHPHLPIHYIGQCAHYGIILVLILKKRGVGILRFQIAVLSRCSEGLRENAFHKNLRI